jgi:RNA polymerase sigma-70 factor (ECF subfamily)
MTFVNHRSSVTFAVKEAAALRDAELVRAAHAGSSAAFADLQHFYSRPLYNTIIGITKNREDAEDALQDCFLRAFVSLGSFEGRSSVYTWLTRIAINSALMILRRRRSRVELSFELPNHTAGESPQIDINDSDPNPEQICDQRQRCAQMFHAIRELEPGLRAPIQLQVTSDCSLKEIAQTLKMSEAAVKARLYRARQRLKMTVYRNRGAQRQLASFEA